MIDFVLGQSEGLGSICFPVSTRHMMSAALAHLDVAHLRLQKPQHYTHADHNWNPLDRLAYRLPLLRAFDLTSFHHRHATRKPTSNIRESCRLPCPTRYLLFHR